MELLLDYEIYKRVEVRYSILRMDNEKWKEAHKDAVTSIVTNNNEGNWEKNYQSKTRALEAQFLEYCDTIDKMYNTFGDADEYIEKMYGICKFMPVALKTGQAYDGSKATPTGAYKELKFEEANKDLIVNRSVDVDTMTKEEKNVNNEISEILATLKYVDTAELKKDSAKLDTGLKKQGNIIPFAETFQEYVKKVDEFNTNISSEFAAVVTGEELPKPTPTPTPTPTPDPDPKPNPDPGKDDGKDQTIRIEIDDKRSEESDGGYAGGGYAGNGGNGGNANLTAGNNDLFNFVRGHKGFENYTDNQIMDCFKNMGPGSPFEAKANSIFDQFKNDPAGFEKKYGFPLYDENGKFNYYKLAFDEFANGGGAAGAGAQGGAATPGVAGASRAPQAKAEKPVVKGLDASKIV